jgi:hypothetical protein
MSAAEIRADIAAAYEMAVRHPDNAARCREQAETLREHAAKVESRNAQRSTFNVEPLKEAA